MVDTARTDQEAQCRPTEAYLGETVVRVRVETPDSDSGKASKARKREEAAEQSVALLGDVAAGYYGGDPSANPSMLALPPAPPPYVPEPIDHPHLGFTPIELPGGALLPSEDDVVRRRVDDDDDDTG